MSDISKHENNDYADVEDDNFDIIDFNIEPKKLRINNQYATIKRVEVKASRNGDTTLFIDFAFIDTDDNIIDDMRTYTLSQKQYDKILTSHDVKNYLIKRLKLKEI